MLIDKTFYLLRACLSKTTLILEHKCLQCKVDVFNGVLAAAELSRN